MEDIIDSLREEEFRVKAELALFERENKILQAFMAEGQKRLTQLDEFVGRELAGVQK